MDHLAQDGIADKVLSIINEIREGRELGHLLNAFVEANNDHVFRYVVTILLGDDFGDDTESAAVETIKELLNSESPRRPTAVSDRDALLSPFATHIDTVFNGKQEEGGDKSVRIEVYFKHLELPNVGPVIDGDLVVQGTCLSSEYSTAVCKVEFAADHEEAMTTAAVIAPWMMMYSPSAIPDEKSSEFAIPISLGVEHREGHVRVRIFIDKTENIPYGEESSEYMEAFLADEKRGSRFVCALDFTTRATSENHPEGDLLGGGLNDLAMGSVVTGMDGDGFEGVEQLGFDVDASGVGRERIKRPRRPAADQQPVIVDVKIAIGYDEVEALHAEGYQLSCIHMDGEGIKGEDEEGKWGYFLMAKYAELPHSSAQSQTDLQKHIEENAAPSEEGLVDGMSETKDPQGAVEASPAEPGPDSESACISIIEDLMYVQVPKDAMSGLEAEGGNLASMLAESGLLPKGYLVLSHDLMATAAPSSQSETAEAAPIDTAVYIAYKVTPSSSSSTKMVGLSMFSLSREVEGSLPEYLFTHRKVLKAAPNALNSIMGESFISGLLIGVEASGGEDDEVEDEVEDDPFVPGPATPAFQEEAEGDDFSRASKPHSQGNVGVDIEESMHDQEEGWEGGEDGGDVVEEDESAMLERLQERVDQLTAEKEALATANVDLQRKASVLLMREKALVQGQSRVGTASEEGQGKEDEPQKEEHAQEKEKQFSEILLHIVEARKKASQQQLEYDQLALDLQTRLDDREFKAGEIHESLKAFKKEILTKAENSRTSKPMSKRLIKQFEAAELQREEDLERVRLRNISMRTQLKKMEKTLRAREQLAEGLYMIDFEQLKVENQTLYEKIEERSEELVRLKRKKTITVQMLTHVREKLRFVENANIQLNQELSAVENLTMARRGDLTSTKKQRDLVREDNKELRLKQGFSSSSGLKTDFDTRKGRLEDIKAEINELRARYEMLSQQVTPTMKK